jgi:SAM-dependent methyltransferase
LKFKNRLKLLEEAIVRSPPKFTCPLCGYVGAFVVTNNRSMGRRYYSACPECGAKERHRLMAFALKKLLSRPEAAGWNALHFAPEWHTRKLVEPRVAKYATSRYEGGGDYRLDITAIELPSASFDLVIASHVLEHVPDEKKALSEIRRILRPGGYALLPVPIYAESTIEYGKPLESGGHYRAPGPDYFDRLRAVFADVAVITSADAPAEHQTYNLERRSHWPTRRAPLVKPMQGWVFPEYVPVCQVHQKPGLES